MLRRIFSQVPSNQGLISICISNDTLTLNKQKERQDKLIYNYRNIYIYNMHMGSIYCIPIHKMCTYCSMSKQYMKEVQKLVITWREDKVSTVQRIQPKDTSLLFKEQKQKRMRKDFWNGYEVFNRHAHFSRETIIYWLPTSW